MKQLDWAVMFKDLSEFLSDQEIARRSGLHPMTVGKVRREALSVESWDTAIRILDTYIKVCGPEIPRLGEHNVYIKEGE